VYDADEERGLSFADRCGAPDSYQQAEALLARDDIGAVVVCSPTNEHRALVTAAARAGKHVLCEKPIATRLEDAQEMIAACEQAGVQLHMAFVCRFYPMVQKAKAMLEAGEIGAPLGVVGGNRGVPPLDYPEWIRDPEQAGGGALIDHSVHVTDAMRFVLGAEVESVFAEIGPGLRDGLAVEETAALLLKFRSGAAASVDPSWCLPSNNLYRHDFYLRIVGESGVLELDDRHQAVRVATDQPGGRGAYLEPFGLDINAALVRHFVRCVRQGAAEPPYASGEDGLRALEIALAGYKSARNGKPVRLPMET
jgi:predicted dehydrogenase